MLTYKTHRPWTQNSIQLSKTAEVNRHRPVQGRPPSIGRRVECCARLASRKDHGGADRDRTDDLRLTKPALSQLSYSPSPVQVVGLGRFELPTSRLSGGRSNQLSYRPASVFPDDQQSGLQKLNSVRRRRDRRSERHPDRTSYREYPGFMPSWSSRDRDRL